MKKKYQFKVELFSDNELIIPEYKIELLNKSKKILNVVENINKVIISKKNSSFKNKEKKENKKTKKDTKKTKAKKKPRTLWVRRKKN